MTPRFFAIATAVAVLTAGSTAEAGITAAFGGLKPTLTAATNAVCPVPAGPLARLDRIATVDPAAPR